MNILKKVDEAYVTEFVYGAIDGTVTTFATVAAAAGAGFSELIIIILGFANLIADGFSMAIGSYLSATSEQAIYEREKRSVFKAMGNKKQEQALIKRIFGKYDLSKATLNEIVEKVQSKEDHFTELVMREEKELLEPPKSAFAVGLATYLAFVLVGLMPLLVYIIDYLVDTGLNDSTIFGISALVAAVCFAGIGWLKGFVAQEKKNRSILQTLMLGTVAAGLAYLLGFYLEKIVT